MKKTNQQINIIREGSRGLIISSSNFCCKMNRVWFKGYLLRWELATLAKWFLSQFQHYVFKEVLPYMSHLMPGVQGLGKWDLCLINSGFLITSHQVFTLLKSLISQVFLLEKIWLCLLLGGSKLGVVGGIKKIRWFCLSAWYFDSYFSDQKQYFISKGTLFVSTSFKMGTVAQNQQMI